MGKNPFLRFWNEDIVIKVFFKDKFIIHEKIGNKREKVKLTNLVSDSSKIMKTKKL